MIGGETKELIYWTNRLRCTKTCLASVFLETRRGIRRQTRALFLDRQEDRHVQMGRVFESARRMHKRDRRTLLNALLFDTLRRKDSQMLDARKKRMS